MGRATANPFAIEKHHEAKPHTRKIHTDGYATPPTPPLQPGGKKLVQVKHLSSFQPDSFCMPNELEKIKTKNYNPPDTTYAGLKSDRIDQPNRGLRTGIGTCIRADVGNLSLEWAPDPPDAMPRTLPIVDPAEINEPAGVSSEVVRTASKIQGGVAGRGKILNTLKERPKKEGGVPSLHHQTTDPITHLYEPAPARRNKGHAIPAFLKDRDDYSFKKQKLSELSDAQKALWYQRRVLAVDNHRSGSYRIAGDQDMLPAATKEFGKADIPCSRGLTKYNDTRQLAAFERNSVSKRPSPHCNAFIESSNFRDSLYWVGIDDARQAMTARGFSTTRSQMSRPASAPSLLSHSLDMSMSAARHESAQKQKDVISARVLQNQKNENRMQRQYYTLIRKTRPFVHHDFGTGDPIARGHGENQARSASASGASRSSRGSRRSRSTGAL